jgi:hypothetical protein
MSLPEEVERLRKRVAERLRELEPLAQEYQQLREVAAEIGVEVGRGAPSPAAATPPARTATAAPRRRSASTRRPAKAGGRQRPRERGRDAVAAQILAAIQANPGRTVAELAAELELAPSALYRPVRQLTNEGAVVKRGRQLYPV